MTVAELNGMALEEARARWTAARERLEALYERDADLREETGRAVAGGDAESLQRLRAERRSVGEEIEDLQAALPFLEAAVRRAKREVKA